MLHLADDFCFIFSGSILHRRYPEHLNMYTPEQINRVFRATASVLPRLGYRVVGTNVIVDEVSLREASLLHAHDQLGQT